MKHTTYLYGTTADDFAQLPYVDAIKRKRELGINLRGELMQVHYTERDAIRLNAVLKAIKFNEHLLAEMTDDIYN